MVVIDSETYMWTVMLLYLCMSALVNREWAGMEGIRKWIGCSETRDRKELVPERTHAVTCWGTWIHDH